MGIFDSRVNVFTTRRAELEFRDRVVGGTPKDPKLIEAWLAKVAGIEPEEEVKQATMRTMVELGMEVRPDMSYEDMMTAAGALTETKETTGFKRGEHGLYLESRHIKAMIKECINILYAGERWGKTKKGPRSFTAERVFVNPDQVWLGVREPTDVLVFIGHVSGPQGPRSTLGKHEYVERARVTFDVMSLRDEVSEQQWMEMWVLAQENGLGALRSQGYGRFDLLRWEEIEAPAKVPEAFRTLVTA